jgi:O-antigen/teichoic acid export membrane protein
LVAFGIVQVDLVVAGYGLVGVFAGYGVASALVVATGLVYAHRPGAVPAVEDFRSLFCFAQYNWTGAIRSRTFLYADTVVLAWFAVDNGVVGI